MKKICIIAPNVFPVPAIRGGAVETLITNFIKENEKYNKIDITVVSIYDKEAFELSKNYNNSNFIFIKLNMKLNLLFENLRSKLSRNNFFSRIIIKILRINLLLYDYKIYKKIKSKDFDYILIEGGEPFAYKRIFKKYKKEKMIFHLHGNGESNKKFNNNYSKFIAISEFVKNKFVKNKIIDESRVTVINNGIDLECFSRIMTRKEKEQEKENLQINNKIVITFCGRTIKEKGILELIKAFKKCDNKNCVLMIIGNSQFGNNAITEYDKLLLKESVEIKDKIIFTGFIENSELYKMYEISDILVVPSIWEEPSGLVVLEGMASKLPLIVTNSGGIPELVNYKNAFIVDIDDKLIDSLIFKMNILINDEVLRKQMGNCGYNKVQDYSIKKYYDNMINYFENL